MEFVRRNQRGLALAGAFITPLLLAVALVPIRVTFANSAASLTFVVVIVAFAILGTRTTGLVASVSAALWFDYFLTEPYHRLAISRPSDLETTIALVVVGIVVTELAQRSQHHSARARREAEYVATIHELTELAASAVAEPVIIERASEDLIRLLDLQGCQFTTNQLDRHLARIGPDGSVVHAGIRWPVQQYGIPGPRAEIPVRWRGQTVGHFIVSPTPGHPVELERRLLASSIADLVGAALSETTRAA